MKKMRIVGFLLALVTVFSVLFAGCTLREKTDEDEHMNELMQKMDFNAGTDYTGKLKIWAQSKNTELAIIEKFIESFEAKYPNIEVELETFVSDAYMTTIKNNHSAAYSSNNFSNVADVMWVTNETLPALVSMEMLAPINYIDDKDDSFTTDALVDSMVEDSKFNSNLYMMPRDYNQFVLYYNKWYFDAYSLEIPDDTEAMDNETFMELMQTLHTKMTKQAKITPAKSSTMDGNILDVSWNWGSMAYGMFSMFGGSVVDENGNVNFNSEENYNAINWIKECVNAGYAPLADEWTLGSQFKLFKTPFLIETRAGMSELLENSTVGVAMNDYLGVLPMPMLDGEEHYSVGAGCSGYAMYYNCNHPTEAWLFLKHIVSEEGQNAFGETGNAVPVLKSLLTDETASWRNLGDYGISVAEDFNHDAFIYKYDTNSCTMVDFKSKIPAAAVGNVSSYMLNAMKNGINNTPSVDYESAVKSILKKQAEYMEAAISKAS